MNSTTAAAISSSLFLPQCSRSFSLSSLISVRFSSSEIIRRSSLAKGESVNGRVLKTLVVNSSTQNQGVEVEVDGGGRGLLSVESATDVVRKFYGGINGRDLGSVEGLIAENCVYEDLIFPKPFIGRKAILEFFKQFTNSISKDLQFVIDDISDDDSLAVGVTWHLDWQGRPFPFSKGCSFYRLEVVNGKKKIVYARDVVEPAFKPGETALVAIRGVTWLLQQFPQLAQKF